MTTTTEADRQPGAPRPETWQDRRSDLLVFVVVLLALAIGWVYRGALLDRTLPLQDEVSGLQLEVPATWILGLDEDTSVDLAATNPRADSTYKSALSLFSRQLDPTNPVPRDTVVDRLVQQHTENLVSFQLLAIDNRSVRGAESTVLEYAHVEQPIDDPFRAALPVIVHTLEYVIYTPSEYWVLTLSADEQLFEQEAPTFEAIVQSLRLP